MTDSSVEAILDDWAVGILGRSLSPRELKSLRQRFRILERSAWTREVGGASVTSEGLREEMDDLLLDGKPQLQKESMGHKLGQVAAAMSQAMN